MDIRSPNTITCEREKFQLLLREGNINQAKTAVRAVTPIVCEMPQSRVNTASYLLAAETLVASWRPDGCREDAVFRNFIPIPPNLFAQTEQVSCKSNYSNRAVNWPNSRPFAPLTRLVIASAFQQLSARARDAPYRNGSFTRPGQGVHLTEWEA